MAGRSTTIPTTSRRIPISGDQAINVSARCVHFTCEPHVEVAIGITTFALKTDLYMSAGEARTLAAALVEAADHFDRESEAVRGGVQ